MPMDKIVDGLGRGLRIAAVSNAILLALLVISIAANLSIPRSAGARSAFEGFDASFEAAGTSVDAETVSQTILGKAVFRTARAVAVKVVDELGRYRLLGTSIGPTGARALIKDTARKKNLSVSPGERLGLQFEIISIDKDGVVVRRGGETMRLTR